MNTLLALGAYRFNINTAAQTQIINLWFGLSLGSKDKDPIGSGVG